MAEDFISYVCKNDHLLAGAIEKSKYISKLATRPASFHLVMSPVQSHNFAFFFFFLKLSGEPVTPLGL